MNFSVKVAQQKSNQKQDKVNIWQKNKTGGKSTITKVTKTS
jgi:hypothetical protein